MAVGQGERKINIFYEKRMKNIDKKEMICFYLGMVQIWKHFEIYGIAP